MEIQPITTIGIVSIIVFAMEFIKRIPFVADNLRWCPIITGFCGMSLGLIFAMLYSGQTDIAYMVWYGLGYGMMACGTYSTVKPFKRKGVKYEL